MKMAREVILKPVVTERSVDLMQENKYTFKIAKSANKIDVKRAVEEIFKVKVIDVKTVNVKGKMKRQGRTQGMTPSWKKAIVTLAEGDTIEVFEGL
jgi:large subunit ribosomal protein L23